MSNNIKELIKFNYENMKKINPEYDSLITDIVCYLRIKLTENDSEEAINDILDMLLSAQNRGENLYKFTNNNYKDFCDNIINAYINNSKYYKLTLFLELALPTLKILPLLISIECLGRALTIKPFNFNTLVHSHFNLSYLPFLIAIVLIPTTPLILKSIIEPTEGKQKKKTAYIKIFLLLFLFFSIPLIITKIFNNPIIISIPNYFVCMIISIVVLLFGIIKTILNLKK